jgi:Dockerin type I domain
LIVGSGGAQRSFVNALDFPVPTPAAGTLTVNQIILRNTSTGVIVPSTALALNYNPQRQQARVTFPGLEGQSLPDGRYEIVVPAAAVNGPNGTTLTDDIRHRLTVLRGDATGDGVVNDRDLLRVTRELQRPEGQRSLAADLNGDGRVDVADLTLVRTNYLRTLASPLRALVLSRDVVVGEGRVREALP